MMAWSLTTTAMGVAEVGGGGGDGGGEGMWVNHAMGMVAHVPCHASWRWGKCDFGRFGAARVGLGGAGGGMGESGPVRRTIGCVGTGGDWLRKKERLFGGWSKSGQIALWLAPSAKCVLGRSGRACATSGGAGSRRRELGSVRRTIGGVGTGGGWPRMQGMLSATWSNLR